jgi:hypothetical protein
MEAKIGMNKDTLMARRHSEGQVLAWATSRAWVPRRLRQGVFAAGNTHNRMLRQHGSSFHKGASNVGLLRVPPRCLDASVVPASLSSTAYNKGLPVESPVSLWQRYESRREGQGHEGPQSARRTVRLSWGKSVVNGRAGEARSGGWTSTPQPMQTRHRNELSQRGNSFFQQAEHWSHSSERRHSPVFEAVRLHS